MLPIHTNHPLITHLRHVPDHYEPFAKHLRTAGYETVIVRNPSVSVARDPGNMLRKDAMVTCDVMKKLVNDETKDVVMIMHSYGGISGSDAAAMLCDWLETYGQPDHGRIRRMVYLAAHVLEKGEPMLGTGRVINHIDLSEVGLSPSHMYLKEAESLKFNSAA